MKDYGCSFPGVGDPADIVYFDGIKKWVEAAKGTLRGANGTRALVLVATWPDVDPLPVSGAPLSSFTGFWDAPKDDAGWTAMAQRLWGMTGNGGPYVLVLRVFDAADDGKV